MAEIDFVLQRYDENSNSGSGTQTPNGKGYRGRGRGRGGGFRGRGASGPGTPGSFKSGSGANTRGRGSGAATPLSNRGQPSQSEPGFAPYESPFARGGGRQAQVHVGRKKATGVETLSDLLYSDRPLLKPIKFVRSTFTARLFEKTEEILETVGGDEDVLNGDAEEEAALHVPTADRVARVFSGASFVPPPPGLSSSSGDEANGANDEEIQEINFDDLGKLMEQQQQQQANSSTAASRKSGKETFTGFNFYERATTETLRDEEEVQNLLVQDEQAGNEAAVLEMDAVEVVVEDANGRDVTPMVVDKEIVLEAPASALEPTSATSSLEVDAVPSECQLSSAAAAAPPTPTASSVPFHVEQIAVEEAAPILIQEQAPIPVEEEAPPASALPDPDTLFFVDTQGTHSSGSTEVVPEPKSRQAEDDLFFVDTEGSQSTSAVPDPSATAHLASARAPIPDRNRGAEPEEEIVYMAPHPKPSQQHASVPQEEPTSFSTHTRSIVTGRAITAADALMADPSPVFIIPPPTTSDSPPTDLLRSLRIRNDGRTSPTASSTARAHVQAALTTITSSTPRSKKKQALKERVAAKRRGGRKGKSGGFGMYGAMASEAALREKDPRYNERRRGDSDVEWGSDDDEDVEVDEDVMLFNSTTAPSKPRQLNPEDANDMSIDPECVSSSSAMRSFARGMIGPDAGVWTTIDDVEDAGMIREEDEAIRNGRWNVSDSDSDDDDEDDVEDDEDEVEDDLDEAIREAEKGLIAEAGGLEDSEDDDSDDDGAESSPGFEARLQRMRSQPGKPRSKGKGKAKAKNAWLEEDDDDSDDDDEDEYVEDELIDELNAILDAHSATIAAKEKQSRSGRKKLLKRVNKGKFTMDVDEFEAEFGLDGKWDGDDDGLDDSDDDDTDEQNRTVLGLSPARKRSQAPRHLSPALLSQWEKDRERKASRKLLRQQSKLLHALDPLSGPKKGGKKGRKAMLLAAQMDPESAFGEQIGRDILGGRVDSLAAIEAQIRQFLNLHAQESKRNRNIPEEIVLPPMPKATRKHVHELALAFNLKSVSKGKGNGRYTTLIRTTRSGLGINEKKVAKIVRMDCQRHGMLVPERLQFSGSRGGPGGGGGGRGGHGGIKHKEGEHVGSAAPKLSDTNLGFKMLAKLGWAEGDRIGLASRAGEEGRGLEQPLKAVIKISKLGLGATY